MEIIQTKSHGNFLQCEQVYAGLVGEALAYKSSFNLGMYTLAYIYALRELLEIVVFPLR